MAKVVFAVRAQVAEADRAAFDHWYATDHLPLAMKRFGCERGWRGWSRTEPGVHCAFYEFADPARLDAVLSGPIVREMIAEFDGAWGDRVTRTREILEVAASGES
jgi:hypothetical protein